jgi:hypothetical protein
VRVVHGSLTVVAGQDSRVEVALVATDCAEDAANDQIAVEPAASAIPRTVLAEASVAVAELICFEATAAVASASALC